jgi:hypothetical protein
MGIDDIHATISTSPSGFCPGLQKVNLSRGRGAKGTFWSQTIEQLRSKYSVICIWVQRVRSPNGESVPVFILPLLFLGIRRPEVYIYILRPRPAVTTHSLLLLCATLDDCCAALSAPPIPCRLMTAPSGWIPRFRGPSAVSPGPELIVLVGLRLLWSRVQG